MPKESSPLELQLLGITRGFLQELKSERAVRGLSLESSLERDLGLGSLERAELFRRVETAFAIELPNQVLTQAVLLRDYISAIQRAHPRREFEKQLFVPQQAESQLDPSSLPRLTDILIKYAEVEPDRTHIYLQDEQGVEQTITYGELFTDANRIAAVLLQKKIRPGETVAMMLPTSREFFAVFFAISLAGAIPVPIYPPIRPDQVEDYVRRQAKILRNAGIRFLIGFAQARLLSHLLKSFIPSLDEVLDSKELLSHPVETITPRPQPHDAALIQYTSGSTGDPKGVLLTHQNLLANIRAIIAALEIKPADGIVSWLPLYHDMGLIGAWLGSLYYGAPLTLLSPLTFLTRPERWLWAIHYHRGTISASPNFGYELCVNKIPEERLRGLDLSSWRLALNGAEAIHAATIRKFTDKFKPYQFNPAAMLPVYGLAESSVALVFPTIHQLPKIDRIDRDALTQQGLAIPAAKSDRSALEIVCCGHAIPGHAVRIVDDQDQLTAPRQIGALQFKGPSAMRSYYHNLAATQAIYHEGWLDSGDLAYQDQGEIYITGRKKDIIITAGRTIYPEEIEILVSNIAGVRKGCVVAFGVADAARGTEQCVIVVETHEQESAARQTMIETIITTVSHSIDIMPRQVVLLAPRTIPKTSSGKLQRSACKQAYLHNQLTVKRAPVWQQMTKIFLSSQAMRLRRFAVMLGKVIYSLYAGIVVIVTIVPVWLLVIPSSFQTSFRLARGWARLILKLLFCRLTVTGSLSEVLSRVTIIVSNHASYADAVVLLAALPVNAALVAKKELLKMPIVSTFVKKLQCLMVDRLDFSRSLEDADLIEKTLREGRSVVIFPEGTFTAATGLRPFKSGAFKLAVDSQLPLCPIGLKGVRHLLRGHEKLLTPSRLTVAIAPLIFPEKTGWEEIARLRIATRDVIAECCGELPIDLIIAGLQNR